MKRAKQEYSVPRVEPVGESSHRRTDGGSVAIYLVHGTWAGDAPWTGPHATLTPKLTSIPGVRVYRLRWKGRNRQSDRNAAAKLLAANFRANSGTPTVLIGHSHGGSVAHDASLLSEARGVVQGVVCLNTPFFIALRRNIQARLSAFFWFWTFGGMAALAHLGKTNPMVFLMFGAVWAAGVLAAIWAQSKPEDLMKKQEAFAHELGGSGASFLCLTSYDDEAFGVLSSVEAICNLPFLLLSPWMVWFYMAVAVGLVWSDVLPTLTSLGTGLLAQLTARSLSVYVYGATLYFVPFILAYPAAFLSRGLAQGLWHPSAAYLVRSVVALVPQFVHSVEFRERKVELHRRFAHSLLYDDPAVCEEIVTWVQAILDKPPKSRGGGAEPS